MPPLVQDSARRGVMRASMLQLAYPAAGHHQEPLLHASCPTGPPAGHVLKILSSRAWMPVIRRRKRFLSAPAGELQAAQQPSLLPPATGPLGAGPQLPQPAPLDLQLQPPGGAEGGATAGPGDTPGALQMPSFDSAEIEALMQLQRQFSPDTGLPIMLSRLSNMLQVSCRSLAGRSAWSPWLPSCCCGCATCCRWVDFVQAACRCLSREICLTTHCRAAHIVAMAVEQDLSAAACNPLVVWQHCLYYSG